MGCTTAKMMADKRNDTSRVHKDFYLNTDDLNDKAKQRFPFYTAIRDNFTFIGRTLINDENVSQSGGTIACFELTDSFQTVKNILNYLVTTPPQTKQKITDAPMIIICGLPRTGSTLLYNLMACDPNARAPLYGDMAMHPIPPIPRSNVAEHKKRIEAGQNSMVEGFKTGDSDFKVYMQKFCAAHPFFDIGENHWMVGFAGTRVILSSLLPLEKGLVTRYLNEDNSKPMYDYHQTVLQMLHDVDPPKGH